ncbi:hypothetical protein ACQP2Y_21860 [Actinoplanes sp. CA-051413]|uniref:hypothetical protein n=1 Tax=Actinoplanes sp. CA-051413 TaxID=3239899 RepID=UPI003D98676C
MNLNDSFPARCDVGGDYIEHFDRPATYREMCAGMPTHRYRTPGMVDGYWGGRCAKHAAWLNRSVCTVEPLAAVR